MNIITDFPHWFIIFCLLLGALFAFLLYYKDKRSEIPLWLKSMLAPIRFLVISLIAFLLLSPLIKSRTRVEEKPKVIFFQDNSRSIIASSDSSYYQNQYPDLLSSFLQKLENNASVKKYLFDENVEEMSGLSFDGLRTDFSKIPDLIENNYTNRNVAAVILASDGIYNTGADPLYAMRSINYPVYTLGLGDTGLKPDVVVRDIDHNKIAFSGNEFPVEVNIQADRCEGRKLSVSIEYQGRNLRQKQLFIGKQEFNQNLRFMLEAGSPGMRKYAVVLDDLENETNFKNNRKNFFIEVIDNKSKILILYNGPHPDIAAINSALIDKDNYEIEMQSLSEFKGDLGNYALAILHQIPSNTRYAANLHEQLKQNKTSLLFILGPQSNLNFFNNLNSGLKISSNSNAFEDAFPAINPEFVSFSIDEASRNQIREFPPLQVFFGNYIQSNAIQKLLNQRIGSVVTDKALIAFNTAVKNKTGFICGTGIWRWRIEDNKLTGNQHAFNALIGKIVQYLVIKEDKRKFRVDTKKQITENENVIFEAELYNDNFELVNDPEVRIMLQDLKNNKYPYTFSKRGNAYYLNAGKLQTGEYNYRAETQLGNKNYVEEGVFIVSGLNIEQSRLRADHNLLFRLADEHGGRLLYTGELEDFADELSARDNFKTVLSYSKSYAELINLSWLLGLIILLLSIEWFLRKWSGTY